MPVNDLFDIARKTVLVTGSSRGIGYALSRGFAEAGATVIINGRNEDTVQQRVDELRKSGCRAEACAFDVTDSVQVKQKIGFVEENVGPIDVLVNNAGIQRRNPLEELSEEDWRAVIDLNLNATFIVAQCVAKRMIKRKCGKIINITSLLAEAARPTIANYVAAKGGLKMLTKAMALEWGKHNIQVNAIGPGYIDTELNKPLIEDPEFDSWVKRKTPAGRWGLPADLVGTAIFLASKASDFVSGQTVYVDGGWLAGL